MTGPSIVERSWGTGGCAAGSYIPPYACVDNLCRHWDRGLRAERQLRDGSTRGDGLGQDWLCGPALRVRPPMKGAEGLDVRIAT